jgi:hypothetical protein
MLRVKWCAVETKQSTGTISRNEITGKQRMKKRPISISILAWIYIATGVIGLVYHAPEWKTPEVEHWQIVWVSVIRAAAIVLGAYMLRGKNWARWGALAWMSFHVVISFWMGWVPVAMHSIFLVIVGVLVFRRAANVWFAGISDGH